MTGLGSTNDMVFLLWFDILVTSSVCCVSFNMSHNEEVSALVPPDGVDYDPPSLQILPASARPREVAYAVEMPNVA